MTEPNQLYTGLSRAAWGYFLMHVDFYLDFNGGKISLLPTFMGFLLLQSAISRLSSERRDLILLRPLCGLLAVWYFGEWLLLWTGREINGIVPFAVLIVTVAGLYFHFQFLTDMAALAANYQPAEGNLDRRILRHRTGLLVLSTAADLLSGIRPLVRTEVQMELLMGGVFLLAVLLLILAVLVMTDLFRLRSCIGEREDMGPHLSETEVKNKLQ